MNKSSILNETPNTILGWPVSERKQVLWCYLIPSVSSCCFYILQIAGDIALCYEHFYNGNINFGILTLLFLCFPSIFCLLFTLITVEFWPGKGFVYFIGWIVVKVVEHIFFPIWAMYGYAERIFWSIEAFRTEDEEREECLWRSIKTRPIELYFFFQAYFQSAPQLLLQINILLHTDSFFRDDTVNMQIFSIIMSLINMAKITMNYQHYESQKLLGRQYPWSRKHGKYIVSEKVYNTVSSKQNAIDETDRVSQMSDFVYPMHASAPPKLQTVSPQIELNEEITELITHVDIHQATTSLSTITSPIESENEYINELPESDKHSTLPNRVTRSNSFSYIDSREDLYEYIYSPPQTTTKPRQISTVTTLTTISEPPNYPAPSRPDVNVNIMTVDTFDNEQIINRFMLNSETLEIPKRKYPQQARGPDDAVGKLIVFCIWCSFIIVRILSISVFARFFFNATMYFLVGHFLLIFIILIYYTRTRNIDRITLYLFLSYIYLFSIIEFRIKFKYFYRTYFCYFALVFTENLILCMIWYLEDWDSWWFNYIFTLILFNAIMCVCFIVIYVKLLKPSKEIIYNVN